MTDTTTLPCPCSSGKTYGDCCQPFHLGLSLPATAEQLMRSRYCAYALGLSQYLIDTLHPSKREGISVADLDNYHQQMHWLGLKIKRTEKGGIKDTQGKVSFTAFYDDGSKGKLRENSRFVKEQGRWFYLDGKLTS